MQLVASFSASLRRLLLPVLCVLALTSEGQRRSRVAVPLPETLPLPAEVPKLPAGQHMGGYTDNGVHFTVERLAPPEAPAPFGAQGPLIDVAVSDSSTTYLVFAGGVSLVDVGMMNNYLVKIESNAVFVRARKKSAPPTPILVRYGSKYWMGRLVTVRRPVMTLYDFSKPNSMNQNSSANASGNLSSGGAIMPDASEGIGPENALAMDKEAHKKAYINAKLRRLDLQNEELQAIAVLENKLVLSLCNVRNDKDFTYMRFKVINNSSIDYNVDFADFQLVENDKKKFLSKKKNEARRPLAPSGGQPNQSIRGNTTGYLYYAVPLFAATDQGNLQVALRELNGARVLTLPIPSRVINTASTF